MTQDILTNDSPVEKPENDLFNYNPLAINIATSIANMKAPKGFVIAINGPWGSGKSTLINFVLEHLKSEKSTNKPTVIRFNPWWFAGQENLVRYFFEQIAEELGSTSGKVIQMAAEGIKILARIYAEVPIVGSKLPEAVAAEIPEFKRKDVIKIKEKIGDLLREKRTLIVIDDIDRLTADEIRQLFAFIKGVADFPNVVYLLAFDRIVVAKALSSFTPDNSGDLFLEKIVQASIDLPVPDSSEFRDLFLSTVSEIVGTVPIDLFQDTPLGKYGYLHHITSLLTTPRTVNRLINALQFTYPMVAGEVNVSDFIAIEFLRVFQPAIYQKIKSNKESFTNTYPFGTKDVLLQFFGSLEKPIKDLIEDLFPNLKGQNRADGRRELRIASREIFDVYFRYHVPDTGTSNTQMMKFVESAASYDALAEYFDVQTSAQLEKCRGVVQRISDYRDKLTQDQALNIIKSLLDIPYHVIVLDHPTQIQVFAPDFKSTVVYAVYWLIRQHWDTDIQLHTFQNILLTAKSAYLVMRFIVYIRFLHGPTGNEFPIFKVSDIPLLEQIARQKIPEALDVIHSMNNRDLRTVLHIWSDIEQNSENAKLWVEQHIIDPHDLMDFINGFISPTGEPELTISRTLYLYFDKEILKARVQSYIDDNKLDSERRAIAEMFLASKDEL